NTNINSLKVLFRKWTNIATLNVLFRTSKMEEHRYMTSNTNDPQNQPTIDPYAALGMATNNSVGNNTFEP
ncbi:17416_t:CDS:2, partial [Rhizophagus irregularis]